MKYLSQHFALTGFLTALLGLGLTGCGKEPDPPESAAPEGNQESAESASPSSESSRPVPVTGDLLFASKEDKEKSVQEPKINPEGLKALRESRILPKEPSFLGQIGTADYPASPAPTTPPVIKLDFSKAGSSIYTFSAKTINPVRIGNPPKVLRNAANGVGKLLLKSNGDGTGELQLRDVEWVIEKEAGAREQAEKRTVPPLRVQGVKEDGSMDAGQDQAQAFLRFLFPIPAKALNVGDSAEIPGRIPVDVMGTTLYAEGKSTVTLSKYVKRNGRICARLDTTIDISKLEVPKDVNATCEVINKGKSVSYYDIDAKRFISGEAAFILAARSEPKSIDLKKGEFKAEGSELLWSTHTTDMLVRLELTE